MRTRCERGSGRGSVRLGTPRTVAVLVLSAAMCGLTTMPSGAADELKDRKERVERQIDEAEEHLQHSSAELNKSVRRLGDAVAALADARTELAGARGELAAAEALDLRMQAALDAAVAELARAREELAEGRAGLARNTEELRSIAVQLQAAGGSDLMALSAVFESHEPSQLSGRLSSHQSVLEKESAVLARLEAAEVLLRVQEDALEKAKREVARRRAAAAENLRLKAELEAQAVQAEGRVQELVGVRREARTDAAAAKAEDLGRLRQFEQERSHVAELLQRRAARARARALAEARARAAAAARAAEQRSSTTSQRAASPAPSSGAGGMLYPVNGYITSMYGMRLHPVYGRWTLHDGTDFGAACGTPIRASASGTVVGRYYNTGYGNRVIIDHGWVGGGGLGTSYNHLSSYSTYVGEHVQRGEIIGYVGSTGYSTGCHLHFMVFRNGATVDPMNWL